MALTLYLVRHGQTEGDTTRYRGSLDIPLSAAGIKQVEAAAEFIAKKIDGQLPVVYCSDLCRAVKSAEIIAAPHGLEVTKVPDLRERRFGVWEGLTFAEIKEQYSAEFDAWIGDPVGFYPPGGESVAQVKIRVMQALDGILAVHKEGTVFVVAHGGVNRIILGQVLGLPLENIARIAQDFAAVNIVEFWEDQPVVRLLNGVPID